MGLGLGPRGWGDSGLAAPSFLAPLPAPSRTQSRAPAHLGIQGGSGAWATRLPARWAGAQGLGGVGPGPGWAAAPAHFLQPRPSTSKATGGPVVTPQLPRSRRGGALTNPWPLSRAPAASKQPGWAALRSVTPPGQDGGPAGGLMGLSPLLLHPHHPTAFLGGLRAKADTVLAPRSCPAAGGHLGVVMPSCL